MFKRSTGRTSLGRIAAAGALVCAASLGLFPVLAAGAFGGASGDPPLFDGYAVIDRTSSEIMALADQRRLSPDLVKAMASRLNDGQGSEGISVIVRGAPAARLVASQQAQVAGRSDRTRDLSLIEGMRVDLSPLEIALLSRLFDVNYITPDREISVFWKKPKGKHVRKSIGKKALKNDLKKLEGSGVTIAVVDSGVSTLHEDFAHRDYDGDDDDDDDGDDEDGSTRAVAMLDVEDGVLIARKRRSRQDRLGHGTHVAGLALGAGLEQKNFMGVASDASLASLRVLDEEGKGHSSDVIAALAWIAENHAEHGIRVVNLSLGAPAVESYLEDPLCSAVDRLLSAGIVVVAAAGNHGSDEHGNVMLGSIHSPAIHPGVIAVGAVQDNGEARPEQYSIAPFSSRGPSYADRFVKPDIVAPGTQLVAPEAKRGTIVRRHGALHVEGDDDDDEEASYMRLSGTSMSTPLVSAAAALILQLRPDFTPAMVKAVLQYTALPVPGAHVLEQGAGTLNVDGALRLAAALRSDLAGLSPGDPLILGEFPEPWSKLGKEELPWFGGIFAGHGHVMGGTQLFRTYQGFYQPGVEWRGGAVLRDGVSWDDALLFSEGVIWADMALLPPDGESAPITLNFGEGIEWDDGAVIDERLPDASALLTRGLIWADGGFLSEGLIWADATNGLIWADAMNGLIWADATNGLIWADAMNGLVWADAMNGLVWADSSLWVEGATISDSWIDPVYLESSNSTLVDGDCFLWNF